MSPSLRCPLLRSFLFSLTLKHRHFIINAGISCLYLLYSPGYPFRQDIFSIFQPGGPYGLYLNPRNEGFAEAVRSRIYVDKTGLIAHTSAFLNTNEKFICVCRPRRFGKSMALHMLAAYYSRGCDSRELFAGTKIEQDDTFDTHLNQYDVIFLNMQQFLTGAKKQGVTEYLEQEVFDEWDCIMQERQESELLQKQYLDFLRNLLKDQPYVMLAYMTGILPVKKYGLHSALNMFWEYSMTGQNIFEEYTGFTQQEVKNLCRKSGMDFAETGSWYDGYRFRRLRHIYNPRSVVAAMTSGYFSNYWTSTETYEALKIYMDMDFQGLRTDTVQMLGGGCIRVNTRSFQNDMRTFRTKDDVLTLLIHLGYLGYDAETEEAFIPNKEIAGEFENAMSTGGWPEVMRVLQMSEKLLEDTLRCDEKSVAQGLERAHMEAASILACNDENSLSCAIGLAYYSAKKDYKLIRELPAGRGFTDIVFLPLPFRKKPALIVELKYNKSAYSAIWQIKNRHYAKALEGYCGEILLVGISYDRNCADKPHSCVIEKLMYGTGCQD